MPLSTASAGVRSATSRPPIASRPPSCGAKPASVRVSSSRPEPMTPAMPRISPACSLKDDVAVGAGERQALGLHDNFVAIGLLQRLAVVFGLQAAPDHQLVQLRDVGLRRQAARRRPRRPSSRRCGRRAPAPRRAGARRRRRRRAPSAPGRARTGCRCRPARAPRSARRAG